MLQNPSWQDTIKGWKAAQTTENLPSRQQMIRAVARTIQILDTKIKQHADAIDNLYGKHRMDSKNQDIVDAILVLQKEMAKLYAAKQSLTKHRLVLAKDSCKVQMLYLLQLLLNIAPAPAPVVTPTPIIQKPSLMQAIKQKIVLAAAAAGVPWVEEDHKRDHGEFAKKEGGDSADKKDDKDKKAQLPKPTHMIETDGVTYQYHDLYDTESIKQAIPEIDNESIKDMLSLKYPRTAKIGNVDNPDTYHKPGNIPFEILKDPEDTYAESMRAPDYKGSTSTFKNGKLITIPNESAASFDYCKAIFRKVWNHHALDIPDTVTGIYIGGFEETEKKRMGAYAHVEKTLHFHPLVHGNASDDDEQLEKQAGQTIHHEIAHVEWFNYPKGTQKTLEDKFSSIEPANPYVKTYHEKWQTTQKKHDDIIARFGDASTYDPESKKGMNKLTKRLKWRKNLYANEQHSALLAHMRTGHLPTDKSELDTYNKLLKSFKDVMGDKAQ